MSASDGVQGIDISKWQVSTPSLAGLDFVFCRASIGTQKDIRYDMHIRNVRAAGLVTGAYHFNWSTLSISSQVDAFLRAAGDVDYYFLDVEYAGNGVSAFSTRQTEDFIGLFKARSGKRIGLYMSDSQYKSGVGQDFHWVARWTSQPPIRPWDFWQWQGSPLDRNRYSGSAAELRALTEGGSSDMRYVNLKGYDPVSLRRAPVREGQDWYWLDGTRGGSFSKNGSVYVFGRADGATDELIVIIGTSAPYADGEARPTGVLLKQSSSTTFPVPLPGDDGFTAETQALAVAAATADLSAEVVQLTGQVEALEAEAEIGAVFSNLVTQVVTG